MNIVLFGPPGVGKGTQARLLATRRGFRHISTGEMLRTAIKAETPLGLEAQRYIDQGRLVPGRLVRRLAEDALMQQRYTDSVLDGYPRTVEQAEWLKLFLQRNHARLHAVISIYVAPEELVERLSKRRVNKLTGENYHLDFNPPPPSLDPALLMQRADDCPEAIRERLNVYRRETQPVEDYYQASGNFFTIDGVGDIETVYARIDAVLEQVAPAEEVVEHRAR